jgi:spermidine synthase
MTPTQTERPEAAALPRGQAGRVLGLVFALGASALIAQSLLVREFLVVCFGNELSIGVIFASWLLGVAAGGATGGRLARGRRGPELALRAGAAATAYVLPLQLTLIRASRWLVGAPVGELIPLGPLVGLALLLGAPSSFCLGLTFAPAAALLAGQRARPDATRGTGAVGAVYVFEAFGALAGGSLFSLVLAGRVPAFIVAAAIAVLLTLLVAAVTRGSGRTRLAPRLSMLIPAALLVLLAWPLERWTQAVRWRAVQPGVELVAVADSRYENLVLGRLEDQFSIYGNGQVMGTFPDPVGVAQQAHLFMVEHPAPKEVLLIGGGVEGLAAELLRYPLRRLDYVSLDRVVTTLIEPYLPAPSAGALSDPRFQMHYGDGRYFVKRAPGPYDLVIVNVPEPQSAMINRFYTEQFFREVARILAPAGVFITRAGESFAYVGGEVGQYAGSVYHTLKQVFPEVIATPEGPTYFFASRRPGSITADPDVLAERYRSYGIENPHFSPELYRQVFPAEWVKFINDALQKQSTVALNTDERPVTYFYGLVLWDRYSGSHLAPVLLWLQGLDPVALVLVFAVAALAAASHQVFRSKDLRRSLRRNLTWAVATTGCAAMAIELVLVYAFQNSFGYVYERVGLIVGFFMFGLALGGWWATRLTVRRPHLSLSGVLFLSAVLILFSLFLPEGLSLLSRRGPSAQQVGFSLLVWVSGLLTGALFPLAAHFLQRAGVRLAGAAGRLQWADHAGACVGAIATGVVLVPTVGVWGTCLIASALVGTSLALLAVTAWQLGR